MRANPIPSVAAEQAEIGAVVERLDAAWNAHDARAFAGLFCDDADFTNVRGMRARGRDGVEAFMAPLFATMFADSRQRVLRARTRSLTAELAALDVWWTMEGARSLDGRPRPTRYGLINLVVRKDDEGWRILLWHNMELAGPPPDDPGAWRFVIFHNSGPYDPPPASPS